MDNRNKIESRRPTIVIAGAGPAGSSLAIRLAVAGIDVTLIERDRFPRQKLCGEFISPESLAHFSDLGVADMMFAIGGDRITDTCFYAPSGRSVTVSSNWFGSAGALSISRAAMDLILLNRAAEAGVKVLSETAVTGIRVESGMVRGLRVKSSAGTLTEIDGDLFIDATGRARHVARMAERTSVTAPETPRTNPFIGFKAHLDGVDLKRGRCEIYLFDGGYGGLSHVEDGAANHCFIVRAEKFRQAGSVDRLLEETVYKNPRAAGALRGSVPRFEWLAVAVSSFGRSPAQTVPNLVNIGDAAAFIDPFTGSGMLMAFESAELLSRVIEDGATDDIGNRFRLMYDARFGRRLRVCSMLRSAAFWPRAGGLVIAALGLSERLTGRIARATRSSVGNG